jgi:hypothetical protein
MQPGRSTNSDEDDEDDGEYIPPADTHGWCLIRASVLLMLTALIDSDDKQSLRAKRARTEDLSQIPPVIDGAERKRYEYSSLSRMFLIHYVRSASAALWSDFQASVASSSTTRTPLETSGPAKLIKIEKRYRFAGEDVVYVLLSHLMSPCTNPSVEG